MNTYILLINKVDMNRFIMWKLWLKNVGWYLPIMYVINIEKVVGDLLYQVAQLPDYVEWYTLKKGLVLQNQFYPTRLCGMTYFRNVLVLQNQVYPTWLCRMTYFRKGIGSTESSLP